MESRFSLLFLLLISLGIVCSYAADYDIDISPEQYWNSALPNTPMPKAIKNLISNDFLEGKSTSVSVGKGGVNVNTGKGKPRGTSVNVGKGGVNVNTPKPKQGGTSVNVGKGGVNVHAGHKGKPVYVGVKPGYSPFSYIYAATETQVHDDPNRALFFLEKDLHPNSKFTLHFSKQTTTTTNFLPRHVAKSIPFSSQKLPQILTHFSIPPTSLEAESIRNTINQCEAPGIVGEDKFCATSLESMVDFSTSKLGKKVTLVSTEVEKDTGLQSFTVVNLTKKSSGTDSAVVCHKLSYPYAVFYCHYTQHTRVYKVRLSSDGNGNGTNGNGKGNGSNGKVSLTNDNGNGTSGNVVPNVVAVCHTDTSAWNPKHLAFQVLKVKPGTVPVCHFLPQDHVVWVSKY